MISRNGSTVGARSEQPRGPLLATGQLRFPLVYFMSCCNWLILSWWSVSTPGPFFIFPYTGVHTTFPQVASLSCLLRGVASSSRGFTTIKPPRPNTYPDPQGIKPEQGLESDALRLLNLSVFLLYNFQKNESVSCDGLYSSQSPHSNCWARYCIEPYSLPTVSIVPHWTHGITRRTAWSVQWKVYYLHWTDEKTGYRGSGVNKWFITENAIYIISAFKTFREAELTHEVPE